MPAATAQQTRGEYNRESAESYRISTPSSAPPMPSPSFEEQLPHFFIVRPDVIKHTASGTITIKGPMVPLVPMDQLPSWLGVVGVPRALDIEQVGGLMNLGEVSKDFESYEVYSVVDHSDNTSKAATDSDNMKASGRPGQQNKAVKKSRVETTLSPDSSSSSNNSNDERNATQTSSKTPAPEVTHSDITFRDRHKEGIKASSHATPGNQQLVAPHPSSQGPIVPPSLRPPAPPTGSPVPANPYPPIPGPDHPASRFRGTCAPGSSTYSPTQPSSPMYVAPTAYTTQTATESRSNSDKDRAHCRHWCHHGTCKYGDVCHYKHEVPTTMKGLRDVGLNEMPKWYKWLMAGEVQAMAKTLGMSGMAGAIDSPAKTQQERDEIRGRLDRQDLEEKQAKLAQEKQLVGRMGRVKPKGWGKKKVVTVRGHNTANTQAATFDQQNVDYLMDQTLEARLREDEEEYLELGLQMKPKVPEKKIHMDMLNNQVVEGNLLDL